MTRTNVLLAGATGMLGPKVAQAFAARPDVDLHVLVRDSTLADPGRRDTVDALRALGATIVAGDVTDRASLDRACRDMKIVASTLSGMPAVALDGQLALLEAAVANGVERFMPSDFSLDYFNLAPGDNLFLDIRKEVAGAVQKSGIGHTFFLNGAFTEVVFSPFFGAFDVTAATARFWGDGDTRFDVTTTNDSARYFVEAACDPEAHNAKVSVAGDVVSMNEIVAVLERVTGRAFAVERLGSVDDLKQYIRERQSSSADPLDFVPAQYQWAMVSGKGRLSHLANSRYPAVAPTGIEAFARRNFGDGR